MKRGFFLAVILMVLVSSGCSPSVTTTPSSTITPVSTAPDVVEPTTSPTLAPTKEPTPTELPTAVPTETLPQVDLVLVNPWVSPAEARVVDASTGTELVSFPVEGLIDGPVVRRSADSILYVNSDSTRVLRTDFSGTTSELTFLNPDGDIFDGVFLPSPDGKLIAWGSVDKFDTSNGAVDVSLKVAQMDGSEMNVLLAEKRTMPSRPQPLRWSNDGASLYFTNMPYGIGGYILFFDGPDLQKIDLQTHSVTTILESGSCMCAIRISPDESQVAYTRQGDSNLILNVKPVTGGASTSVPLPAGYQQGGGIVWSPDGQSLALTLALGNPDGEAFSIIRFDLADQSLQVLLPDDSRLVRTVSWPVAEWIWVQDENRNVYRMNPDTGVLTTDGTSERIVGGG